MRAGLRSVQRSLPGQLVVDALDVEVHAEDLAIVEMVVRRHGGLAKYERSKRLGGACFKITLPGRARIAEPADAAVPTSRWPASDWAVV